MWESETNGFLYRAYIIACEQLRAAGQDAPIEDDVLLFLRDGMDACALPIMDASPVDAVPLDLNELGVYGDIEGIYERNHLQRARLVFEAVVEEDGTMRDIRWYDGETDATDSDTATGSTDYSPPRVRTAVESTSDGSSVSTGSPQTPPPLQDCHPTLLGHAHTLSPSDEVTGHSSSRLNHQHKK